MFIRPCEGRLTSAYGLRTHQGVTNLHQGIDIALAGTVPIYASASGTVSRASKDGVLGTYGNVVMIKHTIKGKSYETVYAHLKSFSVKVGQKVSAGFLIGYMGNTDGGSGRSTAQHLHFEINTLAWKGDKSNTVDPLKYISLVPYLGARGTDVKDLQSKLISCGYKIVADSHFGEATDKALRDFQKKYSLSVDGYAGSATLSKLKEMSSKPAITPTPKPPASSVPNKPTITPPQTQKEKIRMFNPSSATLKQAVEKDLAQAIADKIIDGKWLVELKEGKLTLDDAFALRVIIEQRRK